MNRALALFAPLFFSVLAACTNQVSGGDGGGGSGGGNEGDVCAKYEGDGCTPGETRSCPVGGPIPDGGAAYYTDTCALDPKSACTTRWGSSCYTPLVLSFDGAPVTWIQDAIHGFDLSGGESAVTDWPTARTPWLAIDRDGDGRIADGSELFGSMSPLASGGRAANGFAALRELDDDGDGRLTPADPSFAKLLVWSDRAGDRASSAGELVPAAALGIVAIDLDYTVDARCDARRNCEVERASFRFRDAAGVERTGAVVDVHLAPQR
jgi:hypothetical protein